MAGHKDGAQGRMTLWGIEVFAAIAETGSISDAARRVGASASTVSQQLSNLEAALGAGLLDRAARPIRLTPAGRIFLRRARAILGEASLARSELANRDLSQLQRLRLGVIEDFDADVTPRLLTDMAGLLQSCQFLLETGASHRLFDQLETRVLDVIVAADSGPPADWMERYPLLREPFVAAVPIGRGGAVTLADLADLPLIQYTQRHLMGRQIAAHLARHAVEVKHRFEMDSYHAILAMVAEQVGWTILTPLGFLRAHRFNDRVTMVPLPLPPLSRSLSLCARRDSLGAIPGDIALRLRLILQDMVVAPVLDRFGWLDGDLQVVSAAADQVP
ncbi:LysR family transcriptional regulator [Pseudoruegeria sp. SK021]|uniref:LysR family transcriptional regulator n=1 Tax=Pseudoruegeria sp. SK021 TaxID=1933035 RepID=UPI000A23AB65|nr:LysR family transcriptional regulator [Pseudoruegeria sp. SK021]OSP54294.1 LysR family transcriptional regulator [Pseudoruegeria sp. SK021]